MLTYAQEIGRTFVPRHEAEQRRGFATSGKVDERARNASLYFDDLLYANIRGFNPKYVEAEGALIDAFHRLHPTIYDNREFCKILFQR